MTADDPRPQTGGEAAFERLLEEARKLRLKRRLHLIDELKPAILEREDGVRFELESMSEFKRARQARPAHEPIIEWMRAFGSGSVFFDIGANIGSLSLIAGRMHGGRVPVYAFEPAFDNFAALVRNVLANDLGQVVTPLHVALLDQTAIQPFYRSRLGAGSAQHAVGEALGHTRESFAPVAVEHVFAYRLDDLVQKFGLPVPTHIKLDVDGFEHKVLAGGAEVLAAARCEIYTEIVETMPDDPHVRGIVEFLATKGYARTQLIDHHETTTYPRFMDALFVRP